MSQAAAPVGIPDLPTDLAALYRAKIDDLYESTQGYRQTGCPRNHPPSIDQVIVIPLESDADPQPSRSSATCFNTIVPKIPKEPTSTTNCLIDMLATSAKRGPGAWTLSLPNAPRMTGLELARVGSGIQIALV